MNRLSKSGIEYLDYVWNFYSGCRHKQQGICPPEFNCWAETTTKRFKSHYPNGFEPTFYPEALLSPLSLKKPSRIGVAFMGDLFGDWVDPNMGVGADNGPIPTGKTLREVIFDVINLCPQHTFVFLTKNPNGYQKWGKFPDNCWLGATVCNEVMYLRACKELHDVKANNKFLSFEPLLEELHKGGGLLEHAGIGQVIIGAQTQPYRPPRIEYVKEIVEVADKAGIPVFLKDNLKPIFRVNDNKNHIYFPVWATARGFYRQEYPRNEGR